MVALVLQDAFSLLAYSDPWNSPVGYQLDAIQREPVCSTLNSAILGRSASPWRRERTCSQMFGSCDAIQISRIITRTGNGKVLGPISSCGSLVVQEYSEN